MDNSWDKIWKAFEGINVSKFLEPTLAISRQFTDALQPIVEFAEERRKMFNDLSEAFQEMGRVYDNFCVVLAELGWPPPLELGMDQVRYILHQKDKMASDEFKVMVDRFFLETYDDETIKGMLSTWKSNIMLDRRFDIVKTAVECHIEGKYNASIPTLLPQLEGMLVDANITPDTDWVPQNKVKLYFEETAHGEGRMSELVRGFVTGVLYQSFQHGKEVVGDLNRNAILHGGDVGYGTQVKSLKAILLFNYFHKRVSK